MIGWNRPQQIVAVVALGLAVDTVAHWLLYLEPTGGWFNYAPQTLATFPPVRRFGPGATTVLTVFFIAAWAAVSIWLLRARDGEE